MSEVIAGMPVDLLLVRHGESEGNVALEAAKRGDLTLVSSAAYQRRSTADYRLSQNGRDQARAAGKWLRDWLKIERVEGFDRYYCSPFIRTVETAGLLSIPDSRWRLEPLLRERDYGLWEGLSKDVTSRNFARSTELKKRKRFLWRPESGESTSDIDLRVREMLGTFARELSAKRVLCVTHEDVMWAVRFRLEKMTIKRWTALIDGASSEHEGSAHNIVNCGILHYTRRTKAGQIAERFTRVRLVDPSAPTGGPWRAIRRPRFTSQELLQQAEEVSPLW